MIIGRYQIPSRKMESGVDANVTLTLSMWKENTAAVWLSGSKSRAAGLRHDPDMLSYLCTLLFPCVGFIVSVNQIVPTALVLG